MKKVIFMLLALALMLLAVACQPPHLDNSPLGGKERPVKQTQGSGDIQMTVKEQTVEGDVEAVTLTVENASDKDYTYGAMWTLETESSDGWEEVKPKGDMMWIEIAYVISRGQTNEDELKVNDYYGTLAADHYRIVKTFTDPDGNSLTAYAPFTVK